MRVEFHNQAREKFNKLDGSIKKQLQKFLDKLEASDNPRSSGKALTANLVGLWRYRVGSYRLICLIKDDELIILCLDISERAEVYSDKNARQILKNKSQSE